MKNYRLVILLVLVLFVNCKSNQSSIDQNGKQFPKTEAKGIPHREYTIQAVLWQQQAAEYRALTYQAFNIARFQLDDILEKRIQHRKPIAIVTDIDETILDNSPYAGKQIALDEEYSSLRWKEWLQEKKAEAVPGSLDFFNYAKSQGVEVFYISNRSINQKKETIENMLKVGFPFADEEHVLLKDILSEKKSRRDLVMKSHEIVLLIGDNLSDFSSVFDGRTTLERNRSVDSLKTNFGKKFIVLPNPIYGDWETKGILEGKYNWTYFQKDSIRHVKLRSY